jgi:hypothetical protein
VSEPEDPSFVAGELDGHALAAVAEAVEGVLGQQTHVLGGALVAVGGGSHGPASYGIPGLLTNARAGLPDFSVCYAMFRLPSAIMTMAFAFGAYLATLAIYWAPELTIGELAAVFRRYSSDPVRKWRAKRCGSEMRLRGQ